MNFKLRILVGVIALFVSVAFMPSYAQMPIDAVNKQVKSDNTTKKTVDKSASESIEEGAFGKKESIKKTVKQYITEVQQRLVTVGLQISLILLLMSSALKSTSGFSKRLLVNFTKDKEGIELKKRADTLTKELSRVLQESGSNG